MNIDEFRILHSKIIEQYQFIEWHLEGIYGLLEHGDFEELTHRVENDTMGELIRKVRFLIKENKLDILNKDDFHILDNIRDDRNYWCHTNYLEIHENIGHFEQISHKLLDNIKIVEAMNNKLKDCFIRLK